MIKIENLHKVFDNKYEVLKGLNLSINEGELLCLLGASGCGKSTLLNILAGLMQPTSGDIKFEGCSVLNTPPKDRDIALVFQNYALYPHMTVLENVMFPLRVGKNRLSKEQAKKRAYEYIEVTKLEKFINKRPHKLSGGQQQSVAIAAALVQEPKILLLDEPLNNLDATLRLKIREEIRILVKSMNITTIFVTHDQEEALSLSDKIALVQDGHVVQLDSPQEIYLEPANLFVAKFMGNPSMNLFIMRKQGNRLISNDFKIDLKLLTPSKFKDELFEEDFFVGIRPEYFLIAPNAPVFTTNIIQKELVGKDCILHFKLNKKVAKIIVSTNSRVVEGNKISVGIDYNNIHIFTIDGRRVY
ncbi:MAG: sugar ABC transporter ATP-binding protein [Epulopiscium sp. Nele67-Bin001]|nr:MAG: sugar ABC transporter ATP-binding protein [Epulopiscium sp. Nuni2H_MBin001]OON92593.1 MAG: sugar ABC transporter ATP-binding protein [Epulopiscium sp. Nele67-Bin001]